MRKLLLTFVAKSSKMVFSAEASATDVFTCAPLESRRLALTFFNTLYTKETFLTFYKRQAEKH